jgi:chromosome segregation ATPase
MKLTVQTPAGDEIPVTQDTLVGFIDNIELLTARREMLAANLEEINRRIASLEKKKVKEERLFKVQTAIEAFDSDIKKISVDAIATQRIIDQLKRERQKLQERIRAMTKQDNAVVVELHNCISAYAKELDVSETYVTPNKDYIFTNDLKSLSGAILHKIVFSFKMAYIKLIKEKTGIVLPIVLDSPTSREVERGTVETMLKIIQRDFPEHQLIVASIYDYDLKNKKMIEFKGRLFSSTDIMTVG